MTSKLRHLWPLAAAGAALVSACTLFPAAPAPQAPTQPEAIYTLRAEGQRAILRVLTTAPSCPQVRWDDAPARDLAERAAPGVVPARAGGAQAERKDAVFTLRACEADWPPQAQRARVGERLVVRPVEQPRRIVLLGDTGCRLKGSDNAFQDCNDPQDWPFARVAALAASQHPDLVVHLGDIHYRESPCPAGRSGCAGSPWGYGDDTWRADFFEPAAPLLAAAPWVMVRGNHESCARAGQGWSRFLAHDPWSPRRRCDDPAHDSDADFTAPYAVDLGEGVRLVVFDSSATPGKAKGKDDPAVARHRRDAAQVPALVAGADEAFFFTHHPVLGFTPSRSGPPAGGSASLQAALASQQPARLVPDAVGMTVHGHVHLFQAESFVEPLPVNLGVGNGGSLMEGVLPTVLPANATPWPKATVDRFASHPHYGHALLEREGPKRWILTGYAVDGQVMARCALSGAPLRLDCR